MKVMPDIVALGERCCGCGACNAVCPKGAISMHPDLLGFPHPMVDGSACIGCMSCDRVCPVLNGRAIDAIKEVWWAQAHDELLLGRSSSGGVFGLLAEQVLSENGVICGAAWSGGCRSVRHVLAGTEEELRPLFRSKYVQSVMGKDVYETVRGAIKSGRRTLFVGTACQVSAMRAYLGSLVDSRLFVSADVICHGVSSPRLWNMWLDYVSGSHDAEINEVNFRSKSTGWLTYSVAYYAATEKVREIRFTEDWFFEAFQSNASLRGSCLQCPAKRSCGSDITLGDFWGFQDLHPEVDCRNGISAVICNTDRGVEMLSSLSSLSKGIATYHEVLRQNRSLVESSIPYAHREAFLSEVAEGRAIQDIVNSWRFNLTIRGQVRRRLARAKHFAIQCKKKLVKTLKQALCSGTGR